MANENTIGKERTMLIEGEKLTGLLTHGTSVHIIEENLGLDYYGTIKCIEPIQEDETISGALAIRLDIPTDKFINAPPVGLVFQCSLTGAGCVYRFDLPYRSSSALPDTIWYFEVPEQAERIQLRNFVRVPVPIDITIKLFGAHGSRKSRHKVHLIDISGGGLCFVHDEFLPQGTLLEVQVPDLPRIGTLETKGHIRRVTPIETMRGMTYHIGVAFSADLTVRAQERLVQSIYQLQQSYLSRGLKIPQIDHTKKRLR